MSLPLVRLCPRCRYPTEFTEPYCPDCLWVFDRRLPETTRPTDPWEQPEREPHPIARFVEAHGLLLSVLFLGFVACRNCLYLIYRLGCLFGFLQE